MGGKDNVAIPPAETNIGVVTLCFCDYTRVVCAFNRLLKALEFKLADDRSFIVSELPINMQLSC